MRGDAVADRTDEVEAFSRTLREAAPDLDVVVAASLPSTNSLARALLQNGETARDRGLLVAALEQTEGRGRRGRVWESPRGLGVYASLAPVCEGPMDQLPLLVAVGVCRAIGSMVSGPCQLKWPNDVLVNGRKVAGVLIETVSAGSELGPPVIGLGVNHGHTPPELPTSTATSLRIERRGRLPRVDEVTAAVVVAVLAELGRLGHGDYALARYRERSIHRPGDRVRWLAADGPVEGTFEGFDPHGRMRILREGRTYCYAALELLEP